MSSKKSIKAGIVGWRMGDNSFGATLPYLSFLNWLGCDIRILTPKEGIDEDLDLLVLPGGKDLSPALYGQVPGYENSDPDQFKEFFYVNNLQQYIDHGTRILGICLGMQMLVTKFGGRLRQDIFLYGGHETSSPDNRGELVNTLVFPAKFQHIENQLSKKGKAIECCSLHHQGCLDIDIPDEMEVVATAKGSATSKHKIVEIVKHRTLPILGVQMHPEEDYNAAAVYFIKNWLLNQPINNGSKEALSGVAQETL